MYSLQFPNMLGSARTYIVKDHDATLSNLKLLLLSDRESLFGDPYYGNILQKVIYEQDSGIIKDLVVDEIYTSILTFMPQIKVERSNIDVYIKDRDVYASISCINLIDHTTNLYDINLTNTEEQ